MAIWERVCGIIRTENKRRFEGHRGRDLEPPT